MACPPPACPPSHMKFQLRRATSTEWYLKNPILQPGEPGVETDTGQLKVGNALCTPWNQLPYVGVAGPTGPVGPLGPTGPMGGNFYGVFLLSILKPAENDSIINLYIPQNLAYSGQENALFVNYNDVKTSFEAIVDFYIPQTGFLNISSITNVLGDKYGPGQIFYINLTGKRGTKWFASDPNGFFGGRIGDYLIDPVTKNLYQRTA